MIRKGEKGDVRGEFEDDNSRQLTANRYPCRASDGPEAGKGTPAITAVGSGGSNSLTETLLTRSPHVALLRGGQPNRRCCCLIACKYQQETSYSEPTSLRPLQTQKESVPFPGHPYCLFFMRIYSSLLIGLGPPSPLSVYFFLSSSRRTFTLPLCR
jgi:hypothetical protein